MNASFVQDMARPLEKLREYSLYFLLFFLPISNALLEIGVYVFLAAWLVEKIFISRSSNLSKVFIFLCGIVFFVHFLTLFHSPDFGLSLKALFFKTGKRLLLMLAVADSVREKRVLLNLLKVFILSAFVVTVDGFFQYFNGYDLFGKHPAGLLDVRYRDELHLTFHSFKTLRMTATLPSANDLGTYLVAAILLAFGFFFPLNTRITRRSFCVGGRLIVFFLAGLGLPFSRGAIVGLVDAILWLGFYRNKKMFLYALLIVLFLGAFAGRSYFSRGDGINPNDPTVRQRIVLWESAIKMSRDHFWIGHGLNTFHRVFPKYKPSEIKGTPYVHNSYLQMLAEVGLIGMVAFLTLVACVFQKGFRRFMIEANSQAAALMGAVLAAVVAFLVNAFFDTGFFAMALATLFWFLLGYLMAMQVIFTQERNADL